MDKQLPKISKIYLGADHGGFAAKEQLKQALQHKFTVEDLGAHSLEPGDDYVPYAQAVAEAVAHDPRSRGILLCRSGEGMAMAANKVDGVRAALVWDTDVARETRTDNDANVLSLPTDHLEYEAIKQIVDVWLAMPFSGAERHQRRLTELEDLENNS